MLINEVCKKCSLTKKAVEYYVEQGLVAPSVLENGYRSFSEEDVILLKKISVLRSLGLSVAEIRRVLSGSDKAALTEICHRKAMQMTALRERQKLIGELAATQDWDHVQNSLQQLQKEQAVSERLMNAFPGYYGRLLCLHFAPYLREPAETQVQQQAFDTIISFLDEVDFDIPEDLKKYLNEMTLDLDKKTIENMAGLMKTAVCDMGKYLTDHQEEIESYLAYRQSEEYAATPAYHLGNALRQFNSTSGYNDRFLPAMCRLSETYREYQEELQKANEQFLQRYPQFKP